MEIDVKNKLRIAALLLALAPAAHGQTVGNLGQANGEAQLGDGSLSAPRINLRGGAVTFAGVDANGNRAVDAAVSVAGKATGQESGVYRWAVTGDQAAAPNGWIDLAQFFCTMGGGAFAGIRDCMHAKAAFTATPSAAAMAADTSSRDLVSILAEGYATASWGGAAGAGNARGNLTGHNVNVRLTPTVSYWNILAGQEIDISGGGSTGLFRKYGSFYVQGGNDTSPSTGEEAWLAFVSGVGAAGFKNGLLFGSQYGTSASPLAANGSVLAISLNRGGSPYVTALNGIDLRNLLVQSGGYAFASPGFLVDGAGAASVSTLVTPSIGNIGNLTAVAIAGGCCGGAYAANIFPSVTVSAPPVGATATAVVSAMGWTGGGTLVNGGTGYSVGDVLTPAGYAGTPFQWRVTSVSGGVITGLTPAGYGAGAITAPFASANVSMTGGAGSQAVYAPTLYVQTIAVTGGGSGYTVTPAVTVANAAGGNTALAAATLGSSLTASSNKGQVLLNGTGTRLGVSGTSGAPVITVAAQADGAVARPTLTGSNYTVPANISWVKARQTGTVATQTIVLPNAGADGQVLRISTLGAITALTVSPPSGATVVGAPTTLAANGSLLFAWDAASSQWERQILQ